MCELKSEGFRIYWALGKLHPRKVVTPTSSANAQKPDRERVNSRIDEEELAMAKLADYLGPRGAW